MNDIEMFHVGENEDGNKLYNLRYVKGGMSLPTPSMTEAEALARINGTEVEIVSVKPVEEVVTIAPDYKTMKKIELEALMRKHDIELDRRKSKADLLAEVDAFFKG